MMRRENTTSRGIPFTKETVDTVWDEGIIVPGVDPAKNRKDRCGAWIQRDQFDNRNSKTGWEIDHKKPVSLGGNDAIVNLQPLQWENNCAKGDSFPEWSCRVPEN